MIKLNFIKKLGTGIRNLIIDDVLQNFKKGSKISQIIYRYKDSDYNNYRCGLIKVKIKTNPHKVKKS